MVIFYVFFVEFSAYFIMLVLLPVPLCVNKSLKKLINKYKNIFKTYNNANEKRGYRIFLN